jgi:small subunit ribosomal protein S17
VADEEKQDVAEQAEELQAEETPAEETPAAEAEAEAPAEEETPAEEPTAEAPADEPLAEEAPAAEAEEAPAEEGAEAPAAEAAVPRAKPKRKPRSERRTRSKPKREKPEGRTPITRIAKPVQDRGRRQERRGVVVSSAMDKTIVVRVDTVKAHPRYKKVVRRSTKFHAHDAENTAKVGDVVRIVETRPLSKTKNWRLAEVLEVAK